MKYLLAFLLCSVAMADVSITTIQGKGVDLFRSSAKISTHPDEGSCLAALKADAESRKLPAQNYSCRKNWDTLTAKWTPTPVPVACAVSDFGPWQDDMTSACTGGMLMTSQTRSRSITRPAANGGTACPALTENRTVHKSCGGNMPIVPIPPRGTEVYTTLRVQDTDETVIPRPDQYGEFRIPCAYSHMAYDDPIVFSGSPGASHLHVFFGNTSTDANTTQQSLDAGSSTCHGGTANRSSYWVPAMIDTGLGQAVVPTATLTYYKGGNILPATSQIQGPPKGLKMIGGNPVTFDRELEGFGAPPNLNDVHHDFECWSDKLPGGRSGKTQHIPAGCPVGGEIMFELYFPQCWDGVHLDSPDHRSHMSYSNGYGNPCPPDHPIAIAAISFNIHYPVLAGQDTSKWRLSSDAYDTAKPGGYSAHGDVWIDWDQAIEDEWVKGCLQSGADCHAHMLGDGRMLY